MAWKAAGRSRSTIHACAAHARTTRVSRTGVLARGVPTCASQQGGAVMPTGSGQHSCSRASQEATAGHELVSKPATTSARIEARPIITDSVLPLCKRRASESKHTGAHFARLMTQDVRAASLAVAFTALQGQGLRPLLREER
jgi:hypothetical protein